MPKLRVGMPPSPVGGRAELISLSEVYGYVDES